MSTAPHRESDPTPPPGSPVAIYCRISRDPEGLRNGVERQEEDCRKLAERHGWKVAHVFVDNDVSASSLSSKPRPQYRAMVEGAHRGEFRVLVAYSNSRLTRRLADLEGLIQLHEQTGVRIATVVSGNDDLSTADGRMVARIKASVDSGEAERTSERLRRARVQRAQRGASGQGGRPFGWQADKVHTDTTEARLIREAAQTALDGVPLRAIARDWTARGVRTSRGAEWTHTTLRRLLNRPRLVGTQVHQGEVLLDAVGEPVKGQWEPILDPATFERLQVTLARETASGRRPGARRYLLTGLLRCDLCSAGMTGVRTTTKASYAYTCAREGSGHTVTVQGPRAEALVLALARDRLATEELKAPSEPEGPATDRLREIGTLLEELWAAYRAKQLPGSTVLPQVALLEEERAQLKTEHAARVRAGSHASPVHPDQLDELDMDRQRAVLATLLEAVMVAPAAHRGEPWRPERITPVWRA